MAKFFRMEADREGFSNQPIQLTKTAESEEVPQWSGPPAVLVLSAALFGIFLGWQAISSFEQLIENDLVYERHILEVEILFDAQIQEWQMLLANDDTTERQHHLSKLKEIEQQVRDESVMLRHHAKSEEVEELIRSFISGHNQLDSHYQHALKKLDSGSTSTAQLNEEFEQETQLIIEQVKTKSDEVHNSSANGIITSLVAMGIASLIAFVAFLIFMQRIITGPAQSLVGSLNSYAQGDFSASVDVHGSDEIGQITASAQMIRDRAGGSP